MTAENNSANKILMASAKGNNNNRIRLDFSKILALPKV